MAITLPVSRLINVTVNLSPAGAQVQNLNSLLIVGNTAGVINTVERLRSYSSISDVALDFSTTDPEYIAAALYFAQAPRPTQLYIGRWAQSATAGQLLGGPLSAAEQSMTLWNAITTGSMKIPFDGGAGVDNLAINLSGAANLNAVAAILTTAWGKNIKWDAARSRFVFTSGTTGAASAVDYIVAAASGTPLAALLKATAATGASKVQGQVAETALAATTALAAISTDWYGLQFASTSIVDADIIAVGGFIEAADPPRSFFYTTGAVASLDPTSTTDILYVMKGLAYKRSWGQYSSTSPYASASAAGRVLTTNFSGNNTVITLMYKTEPGVTPENLTTAQANALQAKNGNVYAAYNNNTAIIQYGTVASGDYFDEIYGADYLRTRIQTDLYNILFTSPTKIPQTDAGNQILANGIEKSCAACVTNGLLASGTWQSGGFGQLAQGDFMPKGFYVYAPPVSAQSAPDRAARKSVAFQVAAKLAGAIHSSNVIVNVNR